jgi:hypothetical protein
MLTEANRTGNYRRWSAEERSRLEEVRTGHITRRRLADEIGRSFKAIKHKLEESK